MKEGLYDSIANILTSIDSLSEKLIKYQDASDQNALEFAHAVTKKMQDKSGETQISYEDIIKGIKSRPASSGHDFIIKAINFLRQTDNEADPELTKYMCAEMRDAHLIEFTEHKGKWDRQMGRIADMTFIFGSNANSLFKFNEREETDERENKDERNDSTDDDLQKEYNKAKSQKYRVF